MKKNEPTTEFSFNTASPADGLKSAAGVIGESLKNFWPSGGASTTLAIELFPNDAQGRPLRGMRLDVTLSSINEPVLAANKKGSKTTKKVKKKPVVS